MPGAPPTSFSFTHSLPPPRRISMLLIAGAARRPCASVMLNAIAALLISATALHATDLTIGELKTPTSPMALGDSSAITYELKNINRLDASGHYISVTIKNKVTNALVQY